MTTKQKITELADGLRHVIENLPMHHLSPEPFEKTEAFLRTLIVDEDTEGLIERAGEDERDRLQERVASLREAFKHAHVQGPDMNDSSCTQCGLDLRDEIHLRVGE